MRTVLKGLWTVGMIVGMVLGAAAAEEKKTEFAVTVTQGHWPDGRLHLLTRPER